VLPALERGQDRQIGRLEPIHARREHVGQLTLVHEHRHLPLPHGKLCAVLDLVTVSVEAVDERVAAVIGPLDDIDELAPDLVEETHVVLRARVCAD
jgi:hypothetical protein